jgi:hypothetical protein
MSVEVGPALRSVQGTIAVKTFIKGLLEEINSRERDGVLPETLIEIIKDKLKKEMGGWS